eukprot:4222259-Pleurochrysis_carterae.AAC.2
MPRAGRMKGSVSGVRKWSGSCALSPCRRPRLSALPSLAPTCDKGGVCDFRTRGVWADARFRAHLEIWARGRVGKWVHGCLGGCGCMADWVVGGKGVAGGGRCARVGAPFCVRSRARAVMATCACWVRALVHSIGRAYAFSQELVSARECVDGGACARVRSSVRESGRVRLRAWVRAWVCARVAARACVRSCARVCMAARSPRKAWRRPPRRRQPQPPSYWA